jgi:hypothetical protein
MEEIRTNSSRQLDEILRAIEARELACAEAVESGDSARLTSLWIEGAHLRQRLAKLQEDLRCSYRQTLGDGQRLRAWASVQNDSAT